GRVFDGAVAGQSGAVGHRRRSFFSSTRRHTRSYGDWSSDVCSSDLRPAGHDERHAYRADRGPVGRPLLLPGFLLAPDLRLELARSEERRVGKEWRSGGAPRPANEIPFARWDGGAALTEAGYVW